MAGRTVSARRVSEPEVSLLGFWNETRLRAADARSSSQIAKRDTAVSWLDALHDILKVGYGLENRCRYAAGTWNRSQRRTTPSAGALYPFEVIATVIDRDNYLYDLEQASLVPLEAEALRRSELAEMGFAIAPGHRVEAVLVLLARPWSSMKKYRLRGYTYCHLDVGHTATNLALYTIALGYTPTIHLRFCHRTLARRLQLNGLCREPLVALSFATPGGTEQPAAADSATERGPRPAAAHGGVELERPGREELENWESLRRILSFDASIRPPSPAVVVNPLLDASDVSPRAVLRLPEPRHRPSSVEQVRAAILARSSAKGFLDRALDVTQVSELLASIRDGCLRSDCTVEDPMGIRLRLIARRVDGARGVYAYARRGHSLHRIDAPPREIDFRPACMRQELAGQAAALMLLHAPIRRLVDQMGYSAFAELHFHVAQIAQRLYLAAARHDVGITCIGGFDETECARLGRLPAGDEAIYLVLLGVADEAGFKHDRLAVAYSHGETK